MTRRKTEYLTPQMPASTAMSDAEAFRSHGATVRLRGNVLSVVFPPRGQRRITGKCWLITRIKLRDASVHHTPVRRD